MASVARAVPAPSPLSVEVHMEPRAVETVRIGTFEPAMHGELGGRVELGWRLGTSTALALGLHVGGERFEFGGPALTGQTGIVRNLSMVGNVGLDQVVYSATGHDVSLGGGLAYGEERSWLHTKVYDLTITREQGPHNYFVGGYVRTMSSFRLSDHLRAVCAITATSFRAQGKDFPLSQSFVWWGSAASAGIGLRYTVGGEP
jgi:hypothetical protein